MRILAAVVVLCPALALADPQPQPQPQPGPAPKPAPDPHPAPVTCGQPRVYEFPDDDIAVHPAYRPFVYNPAPLIKLPRDFLAKIVESVEDL